MDPTPATVTPPQPAPEPVPGRTRAAAVWTALGVGLVLLIALIIFIAQNGQRVKISFVTLHTHFPLGIALLVAAVGSSVITLVAGTTRITQLRLQLRRHRHHLAAPPDQVSAPVNADPQEIRDR
jgi:uncharacterized integral membrane protein